MKNIPIHLLINDFASLVQNKGKLIKDIDTKSIQNIWFPISDRNELREARILSTFVSLMPFWYIKEPILMPEIINKNNLNIALSIKIIKDNNFLVQYKDLFIEYKPRVYIIDDENIKDKSYRSKLLNFVGKVIEDFNKWGIKDIHLIFKHIDTGELIELYRYFQKNINSSFTVIFESFSERDQVTLKNSLLLGNLFYYKVVDSILVNYEDIENYKSYIKEDINLIKTILSSLGIVKIGYTIISCPKCGRCQMDLLKINREVDEYLNKLEVDYNQKGINLEDIGGITVAVMGCNVNGPGEARGADIGIAGGKNGRGTIFKYGTPFETLPEDKVVDRFLYHVKNLINKKIEKSGIKT